MTEKTLMTTVGTDAILWQPKGETTPEVAGLFVTSFLDAATTSMGRASHYNTREEQQVAELASHMNLMGMSRDLYAVLLALPGITDRSVQVGMKALLSTPRNGAMEEFLNPAMERAVLYHLIQSLPAPRMLRLMDAFRFGSEELGLKKANNARTRKLILRTLLSSPRLPLWAVKYRSKVASALTHAWGQKMSSALRAILSKGEWDAKEKGIVAALIDQYAKSGQTKTVRECVGFVFGNREGLTVPMLRAFVEAKTDLKAGARLPMEVLEGIRATYHKGVSKDEVLKLVSKGGKMSSGQKMAAQRKAKAAGVEVKLDPTKYDAVRLYLYAFEMGLTEDIIKALAEKALKAAAGFPARYTKVGIVVDASTSMAGDKTQPLCPMAATLAMRDMLQHVGDEAVTRYVGGQMGEGNDLVRPMGDTALADCLVEVLMEEPGAVYVLSDGYENAPAGRFAEVMSHIREIGIETPVYHLNPVFAAEATGVRELAATMVPTMPVQSPASLGATIIRGLIENEPLVGINALVRMALTSGPVEMKALVECK